MNTNESYSGNKQLLLDNAGHGARSDIDPDLYYSTIFDFFS
ncbi:MAG: hypothetical protein SPJ09_06505 [Erysipelotrichaceae bacterium]|nr:hypothetical protein [Erysipelotrichaceae bacterium]MDY5998175.1 hypothetical protein [Erysipelotrichaceae bacterium]